MTTQTLPTTIDQVIDRMQRIDDQLAPRDGVACFNRMYLKVTRLVKQHVGAGTFQDDAFLERLDVIFANLYLSQVDAAADGRRVDPSWQPLFDLRDNDVIWPIQFAFAGMNAHINHDLPLAVVQTCTERGTTPGTPPVHQDYEKVNDLLAEVEAEVRAEFETRLFHVATQPAEALKHAVGTFSIDTARETAWTIAENLWHERGLPLIYKGHVETLALLVGTASRALLVPVVPPPAA
ncbi:DUF5995 family protein [Streptomyces sp. NPDC046805]|uniref:DUF5995 family protein n=1 Tax=Streptomyces sp. NPDC046805 TaxID=3155134 RepID=UPI0033FD1442